MTHFTRLLCVATGCWIFSSTTTASGQPAVSGSGLRARLIPATYHVPVGQPVIVTFAVENTTSEPVTLTVPGTTPEIPAPEVGLPLAHIFSSGSAPSVTVVTSSDHRWSEPLGYRPPDRAPILIVAPHSIVGSSIDVREYFPTLRSTGRFRITWTPYRGAIEPQTVAIMIAPRKRGEIVTDAGTMSIQLFYDAAPASVANFLELAQDGFYNGTTIHRIEPGHFLLAGCQNGDGTGIRPDGKRVPAEISDRIHEKGTLSMSLLDEDPDSASSQFFICNTRERDFDGRYTIIGKLVGERSFATLDALMATPVDAFGSPRHRVYIRSARTVNDTGPELLEGS